MRFGCALACLLAVAASAALAQDSVRQKRDDPAQIGSRDVGKGVNFYSLEKEMALGKQLSEEVQRQAKVVSDPLISEYVNRIGQNLVRSSDAKVPFTFQVIEGDSPNAFALPGGYVFVYTARWRASASSPSKGWRTKANCIRCSKPFWRPTRCSAAIALRE